MILFPKIFILISIINVSTFVSIGGNLDQLRDWCHHFPYVNLIRQTRLWNNPDTPWDGNATFNPITGWPTSDFGIIVASE